MPELWRLPRNQKEKNRHSSLWCAEPWKSWVRTVTMKPKRTKFGILKKNPKRKKGKFGIETSGLEKEKCVLFFSGTFYQTGTSFNANFFQCFNASVSLFRTGFIFNVSVVIPPCFIPVWTDEEFRLVSVFSSLHNYLLLTVCWTNYKAECDIKSLEEEVCIDVSTQQ